MQDDQLKKIIDDPPPDKISLVQKINEVASKSTRSYPGGFLPAAARLLNLIGCDNLELRKMVLEVSHSV